MASASVQGMLTSDGKQSLSVSRNVYNRGIQPSYGTPKLIGYFSLDSERKYQGDFRNMKYIKEIKDKNVNYDLNLMADQRCAKKENIIIKEHLSHFLNFLLTNQSKINFPIINNFKDVKVCTFRGTLSTICKTPYENISEWRVAAKLYKSNIYLCQLKTEEQIEKINNQTPRDIQMCAWGSKFEQFMTSETPTSEPDLSKPNDENEEFNMVFQNFLNGHKLVFGAEIDGILSNGEMERPSNDLDMDQMINFLNSKSLVELKTSKNVFATSRDQGIFRRHKSRNWWIQSYLAGVDKIICGFRDDNGMVKQLESFSLADLTTTGHWSSNVCLNFLDSFLSYVKALFEEEIIRKHGPQALQNIQNLPIISLTFNWRPGEDVHVVDYETDILPDWFTSEYEKGNKVSIKTCGDSHEPLNQGNKGMSVISDICQDRPAASGSTQDRQGIGGCSQDYRQCSQFQSGYNDGNRRGFQFEGGNNDRYRQDSQFDRGDSDRQGSQFASRNNDRYREVNRDVGVYRQGSQFKSRNNDRYREVDRDVAVYRQGSQFESRNIDRYREVDRDVGVYRQGSQFESRNNDRYRQVDRDVAVYRQGSQFESRNIDRYREVDRDVGVYRQGSQFKSRNNDRYRQVDRDVAVYRQGSQFESRNIDRYREVDRDVGVYRQGSQFESGSNDRHKWGSQSKRRNNERYREVNQGVGSYRRGSQ